MASEPVHVHGAPKRVLRAGTTTFVRLSCECVEICNPGAEGDGQIMSAAEWDALLDATEEIERSGG